MPFSAASVTVHLAWQLRLLGATLDASLNFNNHIKNVCGAAFFHTRALQYIRPSLTKEMANSSTCSLVQLRLDYTNALYDGVVY